MAENYVFTNEAKAVFNYIKKELVNQFPASQISGYYYIYSVMCNKGCIAYKTLEKVLISENLSAMEEACHSELLSGHGSVGTEANYAPLYDICLSEYSGEGNVIDTCSFLISIISNDKDVMKFFNKFGISVSELRENKEVDSKLMSATYKHQSKKKKEKVENTKKKVVLQKHTYRESEVEKNLIDVSRMAEEGKLDECIGNDEIIEKIFTAFLKRDRNNVILIGESGSGKTCTVQHIANMLVNGNVPKYFTEKRLMKMDFTTLLSGTGFRGGFESKYRGIVEAAEKSGNYIFFLDDIHSILSPNSKLSEVSTDVLLEEILNSKNIMFIATTTYDGYSKYIQPNHTLSTRFEKITIDNSDKSNLVKIISRIKEKYEKYHGVKYGTEVIDKAIDLSDRFLGGSDIYTVTDVLDAAAANELMRHGSDATLDKLKNELYNLKEALNAYSTSSDSYEDYDEMCRKEIEKESEIKRYEKEAHLNRKAFQVTMESIYKTVSEKSNIPIGSITTTEHDKLKNMDSSIKQKVIGQDEAVDTVCRSVRRQRVGLGNPDKPCVFMFVGESGTGKSFLAKKLSEEVFGSEKDMVRLDMSEYSDKISVNKLHGSAQGYIGYEDGGLLTEAIKKNNHCVLLLDEIEKANEEVFNIFLQVFDEGRLTDCKGITVDFRNVIIIMTSNIGTREAAMFKGPIGFGNKDENTQNRDIIMKNIKKKMPPEFINRIDEIVFFNKLTDDNLREIIKIEIGKVERRVNKMGYKFDDSIKNGELVENIFNEVKKESEYGARPILRQIQRQLEDKLTDYILEHNLKKGYIFGINDIYREN